MITLRLKLAFGLITASILLFGFPVSAQKSAPSGKPAAPVQSSKPQSSQSPIAVQEIDTPALQGLIKRDAARPLLINFWATWCDPCRDEFPDLVKIDGDFRSKGLDFITISLDDLADIKTEVPRFLVQMKATMPAYLLNVSDPEPAIKAVDVEWGGALPATFLYNQKGELVFKHFGRVKPEELRAAIEKLVESKQMASK